jgi:aspartate/tyrosine/aromatic aminotransferase
MRNAFGYTCRGTLSNCNHLGQLGAAGLILDPTLNARWAAERDELVGLIDKRIVVFNDLAAKAGLRMPRYENGFFLIVYTADSDRTAAAMRDEGVFVLPIPGAVRVALCHTPKKDLPRLVDALKVGVAAAG